MARAQAVPAFRPSARRLKRRERDPNANAEAEADADACPRRADAMILKQFYLNCLAHASYLIGDTGSGIAAVVDPGRVLLEVGPANALESFVRGQWGVSSAAALLTSFSHDASSVCVEEHLLMTAGKLWSMGTDLHWDAMRAPGAGRRIPLPTFPFERKPCWPDAGSGQVASQAAIHVQK